jgi:general secretion pathway protein N
LIQRRRGLFLVAALTLLVALVLTFPARIAYNLAASPFLKMSGITGTIWSGGAREFATNGVYLRKAEWTMRPSRLLTGKAVYDVSGSPASGFFQSEIQLSLGGTLTVRDLTASLPLQMFERAVGVPGLRGNGNLKIERLELVDGRAIALDGTMDVEDLVVPMVHRASLGGFRAEFFTQNNGIMASVEDSEGVVELAGTLELTRDKSYAFLGYITPNARTPEDMAKRMQFLPKTDQPNQYELRFEGSY